MNPEAGRLLAFSPPPVPSQAPAAEEAELWPWASIMLFDGRQSNRGWIQEAPRPGDLHHLGKLDRPPSPQSRPAGNTGRGAGGGRHSGGNGPGSGEDNRRGYRQHGRHRLWPGTPGNGPKRARHRGEPLRTARNYAGCGHVHLLPCPQGGGVARVRSYLYRTHPRPIRSGHPPVDASFRGQRDAARRRGGPDASPCPKDTGAKAMCIRNGSTRYTGGPW